MEETKRETEISKVLTKLNKRTSQLEETVKQLTARLTGILRGELSGEAAKTSVPEFSTPLAQEINQTVCRLDIIDKDLQNLRNRLEL